VEIEAIVEAVVAFKRDTKESVTMSQHS